MLDNIYHSLSYSTVRPKGVRCHGVGIGQLPLQRVRMPNTPVLSARPPFRRLGLVAAALLALAGCATVPSASDPDAVADFKQNNDPLEPTNRVFYAVNNGLDTVLLAPLARGYRYLVPQPVRNGLHNVLANISSPVLLANDMLETKPRRAGDTLMRFLINTSVGVGGVFDVANDWGYPSHDADFGVTLALWGLPSGPFLFLPVLGPSNPRDAVGFGADILLDPLTYPSGGSWTIFGYSRYGVSALDGRERQLDNLAQIKKTALDPYATLRSLYSQYRAQQIEKVRDDDRLTVPNWFSGRQ
jgi:phospholipid-binding lipoprotein MlaA